MFSNLFGEKHSNMNVTFLFMALVSITTLGREIKKSHKVLDRSGTKNESDLCVILPGNSFLNIHVDSLCNIFRKESVRKR